MRIAIGADHAGFRTKEELKRLLVELGHEIVDMGTTSEESVDYPDFGKAVAVAVASGKSDRGVLVCGTGIGMSMMANKVPGVRAALITDELTAKLSRQHNDANVFCAGARVLASDRIAALLELWLKTGFDGGRHQRRVEKIG